MKRTKQEPAFYDDREARRLQEQMRDGLLKCYPPYYPNEQLSMLDPGRIYRR